MGLSRRYDNELYVASKKVKKNTQKITKKSASKMKRNGLLKLPRALDTYSSFQNHQNAQKVQFFNDNYSKSPKSDKSTNSDKKQQSPNKFPKFLASPKRIRFAVLNLNAHNLTKSDGEKLKDFYAGPKNAPEADDLPLPDLSWRNHFL